MERVGRAQQGNNLLRERPSRIDENRVPREVQFPAGTAGVAGCSGAGCAGAAPPAPFPPDDGVPSAGAVAGAVALAIVGRFGAMPSPPHAQSDTATTPIPTLRIIGRWLPSPLARLSIGLIVGSPQDSER